MFTENLVIREWLNGSLFPLAVNLTFIIAVYLVQAWSYSRDNGTPWRALPGVKTACSLFWIFLAESVRAGITWATLRTSNRGHSMGQDFIWLSNILLTISAAVLVVSVLRCTYVFTPPHYRRVYWLFSLVSAIAFVTASYAVPDLTSFLHN